MKKVILILAVVSTFFLGLFLIGSTQPVEDEKIELRTIKDNPNFDGIVLMDKNYAFTLRLQMKDGRMVWEKPARSEWILIAGDTDRIVMIGKRYEDGYFSLDRVAYENFNIYDKQGELIKEVNGTGRIIEAKFLPDDSLLLLTYKGLKMFDSNGNEIWKVNSSAKRLWVSPEGNFIVTIRPILSPQGWESIVYNREGSVLGNFFEEGSYWNMKLSSDGNRLQLLVGDNQHIFTATWR